ncbi:hypothetical protein TNCV_4452111 [Trichonephila clavipes]|nr:hypothetical protein TNCV_4452111 [Trichonephila clavipes]
MPTCATEVEDLSDPMKPDSDVEIDNDTEKMNGRGSRVVWVSDCGLLCHGFEPSTTKDPPCRAAMHVKSVES